MKLKRICSRKDMEKVYKILADNNFPFLPCYMPDAIDRLCQDNVLCYLYMDKYVFIYIEEKGKLFLDICVPVVEGLKMTRDFIYFILDVGFNRLEYEVIHVVPTTKPALIMESKRLKHVGDGVYEIKSDNKLYGRDAVRKYFRRRDRR